MTQTEFEQKKEECWEEFCKDNPAFNHPYCHEIYCRGFNRAYALGKQEKDELSPADNVNLSQETANCDKQFDKILNDSLRERNRLNIAAMIEPALISCPDLWKRHGNYYAGPGKETRYSFAKLALEYADALLAECESFEQKGGR